MTLPRGPNYKRQKWLLLLLKEAGGRLSRTDFQKLLFLLSQDQEEPHFDFVPYRYGGFSYQAMADLDTLLHQGWLTLTNKTISLKPDAVVRTGLPQPDIAQLVKTLNRYRHLRGRKLVRHVYERFPYFAVNSEIAEDILDDVGIAAVETERRALNQTAPALFTIGYEGLKFETYVNRLILNNVRLLCDVRKTPSAVNSGSPNRRSRGCYRGSTLHTPTYPNLELSPPNERALKALMISKLFFRNTAVTYPIELTA